MKKKKRLLFIIIALLIATILAFLFFIYPVSKNNSYLNKIKKDIKDNTSIEEIDNISKDNNYYILTTNKEVIVLDLNYEKVFSLSLTEIKESDLDFTYRRNNLYYKEKVKEKDKLTYKFYNVKTLKLEYESQVGGA